MEKESLGEDLEGIKTSWSEAVLCSRGVNSTEMMWRDLQRQSLLLKELALSWLARRAHLS